MNSTSSSAAAAIGVGLVSVGWMGKLHTQGVEAKKFLVAVTGGERRNATVEDAHAVAEVIAAAHASAAGGTWQAVPAVPGTTFGGPVPAQGPPHG
jgi:prephenate dehydrogenase